MASSNAPVTRAADNPLSIAYRDLETANKQLEEATIELNRLRLMKLQNYTYPSGDFDELNRERHECLRELFGTPPPSWWIVARELFESEWWRHAEEAGLANSVELLDERIDRAEADKFELEAPQASIRRRIADMTRHQVRNLSVLDLPEEILVAIFRYVEDSDLPSTVNHDWGDEKDIASARLVCRRFCYAASGFLVRRICVEPTKASLARLEEVSRHPAIAAGIYYVKLVLRYYDPALASVDDFVSSYARSLGDQIETWKESQPDPDDVGMHEEAAIEDAEEFAAILIRDKTATRYFNNLFGDDYDGTEWLSQVHSEYLQLVEEQRWLLDEGRFAQAAGSAMARMPRARHLEIVDTDLPEVELWGPGVELWSAMEEYMRQPMGGGRFISRNRRGILRPNCQCVVDMLNGVRGGGTWLETLAISLRSPWPISIGDTWPSGLQKLKRFDLKMTGELDEWSLDGMEAFVRACIDTPSLEYIGIDIKGHTETEPSVDISRVMGMIDRPLLKSLWLCRVDFDLKYFKILLNHLTHERVSLSMADPFLLSGTWKELLDVLRDKEAGEKWLRRPAGQEIEDMSDEDYLSIFGGKGGGGIAQLYISKKLSGWSAPNPIQALEERLAAEAAEEAAAAGPA